MHENKVCCGVWVGLFSRGCEVGVRGSRLLEGERHVGCAVGVRGSLS